MTEKMENGWNYETKRQNQKVWYSDSMSDVSNTKKKKSGKKAKANNQKANQKKISILLNDS
jgi:hypothetical protein